jgi:phage tail protein X
VAEYTTIQGDTWDSIAHKLYGSSLQLERLMEANPQHMRIVVFGAGVVLQVPELPEQPAAGLPPWRRTS